MAVMRRDKKATRHGLAWVLVERLGQGRVVEDVAWEEIERELAAFLVEAKDSEM